MPRPVRQELPVSREEFEAMWRAGLTIDCISRRTGVSRHGVSRFAKEFGMPPRCVPRADRLPAIKDEFASMWTDPDVSRAEIGVRFGISDKTASKWAASFGLPHKAVSEPDWNGPQPGDPTEDEILELAAYLRARRTMTRAFNFDDGERLTVSR